MTIIKDHTITAIDIRGVFETRSDIQERFFYGNS